MAGRYQTGWATLERCMLGLITIALWRDDILLVDWLKNSIQERLNGELAPDQTLRDRAERGVREEAARLRVREFETDRMLNALNQIDRERILGLMTAVANILSPGTANETVRRHF